MNKHIVPNGVNADEAIAVEALATLSRLEGFPSSAYSTSPTFPAKDSKDTKLPKKEIKIFQPPYQYEISPETGSVKVTLSNQNLYPNLIKGRLDRKVGLLKQFGFTQYKLCCKGPLILLTLCFKTLGKTQERLKHLEYLFQQCVKIIDEIHLDKSNAYLAELPISLQPDNPEKVALQFTTDNQSDNAFKAMDAIKGLKLTKVEKVIEVSFDKNYNPAHYERFILEAIENLLQKKPTGPKRRFEFFRSLEEERSGRRKKRRTKCTPSPQLLSLTHGS